jgi:glycosyltransferase involved in cell wall biosynthesis
LKVALVTTGPGVRSGIGDYARRLAPHLARHCELEVYLPDGQAAELADSGYLGLPARAASTLGPRSADRILYQLGNERAHAFMLPHLRALGGCVVQHDWVLFDLATAAFPALERGGPRGRFEAWRQGGLAQARVHARARRAAREARAAGPAPRGGEGSLLGGWHAPEPAGRWTSARAGLSPARAWEELELALEAPAGRRLRVLDDGRERATWTPTAGPLLRVPVAARPLVFAVDGARGADGDARTLGVFVRRIAARVGETWEEQDLAAPVAALARAPSLSDARFELPLNRGVVRFGDAFLVHSKWMRDRILAERNAYTPIGFVPHGAQRLSAPGDRCAARARLGVPDDAPLLVSFGAIQEHKRVEPLLRAFARARAARPALRLVLAGALATEVLDVPGLVARLGLGDAVTITGWLEERTAVDWIHAADLCVQLRGPSTGGTSGGIALALACGRGVVVSDLAEQRELPADAVRAVAPGEGEVDALAALLLELTRDRDARARLEEAARRHVASVADWARVGELYAAHLARFPAHRAGRKSLIAAAIEAADRRRAERAAEDRDRPGWGS